MYAGVINRFVDPEFDIAITSSVMCKFLGQNTGSIKSCKIEYGPEQSCPNLTLSSQGDPTATDSVVVGISLLNNVSQYCYLLTASNGTMTVAVTGMFTTGSFKLTKNTPCATNFILNYFLFTSHKTQ